MSASGTLLDRSRSYLRDQYRVRLSDANGETGTLVLQSAAVVANKGLGLARTVALAALLGPRAALDLYFALQVLLGITALGLGDQLEVLVTARTSDLAASGDARLPSTPPAWGRAGMVLLVVSALVAMASPLFAIHYVPASAAVGSWTGIAASVGACVASYVPYRLLAGIARGRGHHRSVILAEFCQGLSFFTVSVGLLLAFPRLNPVIAMLAAQAAASALGGVVLLWITLRAGDRFVRWEVLGAPGFAPRLATLYVTGVVLFGFTVVDRFLAGRVGEGGLAALGLASTISMTSRSIVSYEFILAADWLRRGREELAMRRAFRTVLVYAVPVTFLLVASSQPLIEIAFQRGNFHASDTLVIARVLRVYAWATSVFLAVALTQRMLLLGGHLRDVVVSNLVGLAGALAVGFVATRHFGAAGAVGGTLAGFVIVLAFQVRRLVRGADAHVSAELWRGAAVVAVTIALAESVRMLFGWWGLPALAQLVLVGLLSLAAWRLLVALVGRLP